MTTDKKVVIESQAVIDDQVKRLLTIIPKKDEELARTIIKVIKAAAICIYVHTERK